MIDWAAPRRTMSSDVEVIAPRRPERYIKGAGRAAPKRQSDQTIAARVRHRFQQIGCMPAQSPIVAIIANRGVAGSSPGIPASTLRQTARVGGR